MKRAIFAALAAGGLALTACSSSTPAKSAAPTSASSATTGAPVAGPHNDADVQFAMSMIPHHGQAVQMADQALSKATNASVKALAAQIKGAQDPEIKMMSGWLAGWGAAVPSASMDPSMGGMGMAGMMSAAEMRRLDTTDGASFDRLWLELMVKHHTGAITMAKSELTSGQNESAKKLAQSISTSQAREVATMTKLLATLPS